MQAAATSRWIVVNSNDSAASGDTILLGPGTFTGPGNRIIVITGKDLSVESMSGPETTTIDCELGGPGFWISGSDMHFAGITIRRAQSPAELLL